MNRDQKSARVSELGESFNRAKFAVVTDYCGLSVSQLQKIRIELRECNSEIRIAKNTLLKMAVTGTDSEKLADDFVGTMKNSKFGRQFLRVINFPQMI